jgi:large subunit ribosomal protein L17
LVFTAESVVHRLIETVAPRFEDRPGGYTRLVHLSRRRLGDASPLAMIQLVGDEEAPTSLTKPKRSARKRRADARYAAAIQAAKARSAEGRAPAADVDSEPEDVAPTEEQQDTAPDQEAEEEKGDE